MRLKWIYCICSLHCSNWLTSSLRDNRLSQRLKSARSSSQDSRGQAADSLIVWHESAHAGCLTGDRRREAGDWGLETGDRMGRALLSQKYAKQQLLHSAAPADFPKRFWNNFACKNNNKIPRINCNEWPEHLLKFLPPRRLPRMKAK